MENQPQEVFDDVTLPFRFDLKAMAERVREHTELAAEPLAFTRNAVVRGIKRARGYASSLADLVEYGDNYPPDPALVYARLNDRR